MQTCINILTDIDSLGRFTESTSGQMEYSIKYIRMSIMHPNSAEKIKHISTSNDMGQQNVESKKLIYGVNLSTSMVLPELADPM